MNFKLTVKRILPLAYFLAASLSHHPFSDWFDKTILFPMGRDIVQSSADILTVLMLMAILVAGVRVVRVHRAQAVEHFGIWLLFLILMYVSDRFLIINNIERIHFPQYAFLSLILGMSLRNELLIFFTSSFAGFFDELLQYMMNPNRTNYLDFNDIVFNMLGAGIGIALLIGFRKPLSEETSKYEKRFRIVLITSFWASVCLAVMALAFDRFVMIAEQVKPRNVLSVIDGKLSFILSFEKRNHYWVKTDYGKIFHPFSPFEGLSMIALLSVFTWWWTRWLKRDQREIQKRALQ
jgi:hypothetical protein